MAGAVTASAVLEADAIGLAIGPVTGPVQGLATDPETGLATDREIDLVDMIAASEE